MPERKVNPKLVALALARGATQVQAYREGGGECEDDGSASRYCNSPEVSRLKAYFEMDTLERLKGLLTLADTDAHRVLAVDEAATNRDRAEARSYAAQRERTHTATQVEITHKIDFAGLSRGSTPVRTLEAAATSSLQLREGDSVPGLPSGEAVPALKVGREDTVSLPAPTQPKATQEDTQA